MLQYKLTDFVGVQPMTQQSFKGACIKYTQFMQRFEAISSETKKRSKAQEIHPKT